MTKNTKEPTMKTTKPMTCFVTFDLSILDDLRNLFRGCGMLFDINGPARGQFISVQLPRKPLVEQESLLDSVYRHANRLAR